MSFRMYVARSDGKEMQIFGNNDVPSEIFEELYKQGLPEFEDSFHDFKIKELQPIIDIMKSDLAKRFNKYEKNKEFYESINRRYGASLFDFTSNLTNRDGTINFESLYIDTLSIVEDSWMFQLYRFIEFLKPDIDWAKSDYFDDLFVSKDNAYITVEYF